MKIKKTGIPEASRLRQFFPADYTDAFELTADYDIEASPDDVLVGFLVDMPKWVNALFKLRNFLVKFVGLQGSNGESAEEFEKRIRTGGSYHFAEIPEKTPDETVIIMRDKHLDAYLSVLKNNNRSITVNTLVHYNNRLGKIYFFFIRPFHGIVIKTGIKRAVKK